MSTPRVESHSVTYSQKCDINSASVSSVQQNDAVNNSESPTTNEPQKHIVTHYTFARHLNHDQQYRPSSTVSQ